MKGNDGSDSGALCLCVSQSAIRDTEVDNMRIKLVHKKVMTLLCTSCFGSGGKQGNHSLTQSFIHFNS